MSGNRLIMSHIAIPGAICAAESAVGAVTTAVAKLLLTSVPLFLIRLTSVLPV